MKIKATLLTLLAGALLLVAVAPAQDQGQGRRQDGGLRRMGGMRGMRGMGDAMLLARKDVQDDLKLTTDQKDKLDGLREEMQASMREKFQNSGGEKSAPEAMQKMFADFAKELDTKLNAILTADQQKRLKEIGIQMAGSSAATRPEVAKELALTEVQNTKIKTLTENLSKANRSLVEKMRAGEMDRETLQATMKKNNEALNTEIDKILTEAQKTKLKAMGGAPFTRVDDSLN